jgi:hypothetical protein
MGDEEHRETPASIAADIGKPVVVKVWDKDGKQTQQFVCLRVGQLGLHENMLLTFEGDSVRDVIRLGDLKALRVDMRRSFRHPVAGMIVGVAMMLAPVTVLLGAPLYLGGLFGGGMFCISGPFFLGVGGYTLFEVIHNRKLPCLMARSTAGESAHPLERELSEDESKLLAALTGAMAGMPGREADNPST